MRLSAFCLALGLSCTPALAAQSPAPTAPRKNELFAWGGGASLDSGLSTSLFGVTYGRYLRPWFQIEVGVERYSGRFSGQWLRLNALFSPPLRSRLRPYFLAGTSSFYPELGGGVKVKLVGALGARVEVTTAADDDEGWYANLRGGVLLSF